jgi:prevent-host-death family protein
MMQVNIQEAKTHFSELIVRVVQGEEITIAKAGKPVARLVSMNLKIDRRIPGTAKGIITISDNFDDPLPESVLRDFEL